MKFAAALIAAVASQAVAAFKVPEGTPDGIYRAYYDSNGNEVHERLGDVDGGPSGTINSRNSGSEYNLFKRNQAWCGCGIQMAGGDCDAATHAVENYLGGGKVIDGFAAVYSAHASVVAFVCNHSRSGQFASGDDARNSWHGTTAACGYYIAGTWEIATDLTGGYMRTPQEFCRHDRDASSHHC